MRKTSIAAGCVPVLAVLLAAMSPVVSQADEGNELLGESQGEVAFPEGYRDWTRVKSMVILPGHVHYDAFGGFHHVYANDEALAALKQGGPFPKGAVLVFDLLKEIVEDKEIVEGPRQVVGVMEKDSGRFAATEGWGFEDFKEGDPLQPSVTDMREQCLSCHVTRSATDYVYSTYHD